MCNWKSVRGKGRRMWTCVMENQSVKRKMSVIMGKWKWKKKM